MPGKQRLEKYQYEFYRKWYHTAIRSLIGIVPFYGDHATLADSLTPAVSVREVRKSVALLEKLELIRKDDTGRYVLSNTFITTGESWRSLVIKDFQRETMHLAEASIDRHPKGDRDVSTVTVAVNKKNLVELKSAIAEFRNSILKFSEESTDPDSVYQLNVQLFPMALPPGDRP